MESLEIPSSDSFETLPTKYSRKRLLKLLLAFGIVDFIDSWQFGNDTDHTSGKDTGEMTDYQRAALLPQDLPPEYS